MSSVWSLKVSNFFKRLDFPADCPKEGFSAYSLIILRQLFCLPQNHQSYGCRSLVLLFLHKYEKNVSASTGQASDPIRCKFTLQSPVFLVNSCRPHFSDTLFFKGSRFLRSHARNLPSSFPEGMPLPLLIQRIHLCWFEYGKFIFSSYKNF